MLLHKFLAQVLRLHLLVFFRLDALGRGRRLAGIEDSVGAADLQLTHQVLQRPAANQFRLVRRETARRARFVAGGALEGLGVAFLAEAVAFGAPARARKWVSASPSNWGVPGRKQPAGRLPQDIPAHLAEEVIGRLLHQTARVHHRRCRARGSSRHRHWGR